MSENIARRVLNTKNVLVFGMPVGSASLITRPSRAAPEIVRYLPASRIVFIAHVVEAAFERFEI